MKKTQRKHALIAGISLIVMAVAAMFAYGYVFTNIEAEGDPVTTWEQLIQNRMLFKAGLGGWLIIFITDLLVTYSLFYFFRDTHKKLSMATAAMRFMYTCIFGVALVILFTLLPLLNEVDANAIRAGNRTLEIMGRFQKIWSLGLIIFGLHLLGLGYLCILRIGTPNFFGYLLLFAGFGYIAINTLKAIPVFSADSVDLLESILMAPMALGEILFAIWLIVKGGKKKKN